MQLIEQQAARLRKVRQEEGGQPGGAGRSVQQIECRPVGGVEVESQGADHVEELKDDDEIESPRRKHRKSSPFRHHDPFRLK